MFQLESCLTAGVVCQKGSACSRNLNELYQQDPAVGMSRLGVFMYLKSLQKKPQLEGLDRKLIVLDGLFVVFFCNKSFGFWGLTDQN